MNNGTRCPRPLHFRWLIHGGVFPHALHGLAIVFLAVLPHVATAGTQTSSIEFTTSGQPLGEIFSIDQSYGIDFDFQDETIVDIGNATPGNTGLEITASLGAELGLTFEMSLDGGSVSAALAYDVGFSFNRAELGSGATNPTISTFATLKPGASFNTVSPDFELFSEVIAKAHAGISGTACVDAVVVSDCGSFNESLFDEDLSATLINVNRNGSGDVALLDPQMPVSTVDTSQLTGMLEPVGGGFTTVQVQQKGPAIFGLGTLELPAFVELEVKHPDVNATGVLDADQGILTGSASDKFLKLDADIDSILGLAAGGKSGGAGFIIESGEVFISASVDAVDLEFKPSFTLEQSFTLTPTLKVALDFDREVDVTVAGIPMTIGDNQTLDLDVGDDFQIDWDDSSKLLKITPTYSLAATFVRDSKFTIDVSEAELNVLKASFKASVLGIEIVDFSLDPVIDIDCKDGKCEIVVADFIPGQLNNQFNFIEPVVLDFKDQISLASFNTAVGDVLVLDGRDAVWEGGAGDDNWFTPANWRGEPGDELVGDDDRDVVLDIDNVGGGGGLAARRSSYRMTNSS